MFSDHLRVTDPDPVRPLLVIAALLVIVCQLLAMVLVAGGQVKKAELRDASQASARSASIGCMHSSRGAALKDCDRTSQISVPEASAEQGGGLPQGITLVTASDRR